MSRRPVVSSALTIMRLDYDVGACDWANTNWLGDELGVEFRSSLREIG